MVGVNGHCTADTRWGHPIVAVLLRTLVGFGAVLGSGRVGDDFWGGVVSSRYRHARGSWLMGAVVGAVCLVGGVEPVVSGLADLVAAAFVVVVGVT